MVDVCSGIKTGTCSNVSTTNAYIRRTLNVPASYRGTTYTYPQKLIIALLAQCLSELGFEVVVNNTNNYQNHLVLKDYSEEVCLQLYHSGQSAGNLAFLYPRCTGQSMGIGSLFNNGTACNVTIRMVGEGAGKTKTMLLLGGSSIPGLNGGYAVYFTEAKFLPTGEMKKAAVLVYGSSYYFYLYDNDWTFLPGFRSELATEVTINSYWNTLTYSNGYRGYVDPYVSYKMFQEQNNFPEFTLTSNNGLWEFPDIIYSPYGHVVETDVSEKLKYTLTAGNIYEIGGKKYLYPTSGYYCYLFRVE